MVGGTTPFEEQSRSLGDSYFFVSLAESPPDYLDMTHFHLENGGGGGGGGGRERGRRDGGRMGGREEGEKWERHSEGGRERERERRERGEG